MRNPSDEMWDELGRVKYVRADITEALEAKLEKATEGLLEILRIVPLHPAGDIALATLRAIKGEDKC